MLDAVHREAVYLWYYFSLQLSQIFRYWVLGMVLGSAISVFARERIHALFRSLHGRRLGILGIFIASALGIASPLCMYGTIPLAASFSESGMEDDWLAAFMMSSVLLNPQLILYSMALGRAALVIRILSSFLCGGVAGLLLRAFYRNGGFFHFADYDSCLVLSHFKGHAMAGYGGAIKNISIGLGSQEGKCPIHTGGQSRTSPWGGDQTAFTESMAEAGKSISDYLGNGEKIVYINVMNRLSIDCDCDGNPSEPDLHDIGILASADPVALD